jgi:hypothetical protein
MYAMIRRWLSRAAAVLAAVMLSGVPAVAAQLTNINASSCCCGGGHGAQCPMKRPGSAPKKPCHDSSPDSKGEEEDCCPTISPCAAPFAPATPPPRADDFTLFQLPAKPRPPSSTIDADIPALRGDVPPLPETPPPKRA